MFDLRSWAAAAVFMLAVFAPAVGQEARGPLAALPSTPGAHLKKIQALGDNQWLNLGAPAEDSVWGKARGSSWGAKALVAAPDKRGAFLFGEGVHGFVKPDGHAMDDLWFYDINRHAWICLYPGMNTKTFNQRVKAGELKLDAHGLLRTADGQPLPVHTLIHAWSYLTYDSDRGKFAFAADNGLNRYYLGGLRDMEEGLSILEQQIPPQRRTVFSPWFYDIASGKFERSATANERPINPDGFFQFHYVAAKKMFFGVGSATVAIYDPAKNLWSDAQPQGPMPKGWDCPGCYDSKRQRVYRNNGDGEQGLGLMAYEIEANTWRYLQPGGTPPEAKNTNGAYYEYDSVHDLVIVIQMSGKTPGIFTYNPQANEWSGPLPFPADGPQFRFAGNTCYDRTLNVYFCHVASDSGDDGQMWVYRYKR